MTITGWVERMRGWLGQPEEDTAAVAAAPAVPLRQIVRRFWPDARPYRRWLLPMLLFVALGPALETATIWLYKLLVDDVLVPGNFALFPTIALAYLGLTLLSGAISFGDDVLSDWVSERFLLDLRTRVFAHLHQLPPDFLSGKRRGDLVARLSGDVAEVETLLISGAADLLSYALRIVFFAGALLYLNWRLALLAFVVAPLFWFASQRFATRFKRVAREQRRRSGAISAVAEESLANAMLVRAYNREQDEVDRFRREGLGNFTAQMGLTRLRAFFAPILDLFELGGMLAVIGAGAWAMSRGEITLGGLLVFATYLTQLYSPVRGLTQLLTSVATASAGAERVIELLDQPPAVSGDGASVSNVVPSRGALALDAVSFSYPESLGPPVLEDITLRVEPGQTLAIVGASGAGKSTLVRLLLRFYDPTAGTITIGGQNLREIDLRSWRDHVAVVLQESLIFVGTIRDNIAFGRPGTSEGDIMRAAMAADAHEFIAALPRGYDTVIGQGGAGLSGGQRQRLAIARALVRDAPILILDEPTSGLDAAATDRVLSPLRRLMSGRATIVISHNLVTVREATEIIVLEEGRIAERGSHEALMAMDGAYARLYRMHHPDSALSSILNGKARELAGAA